MALVVKETRPMARSSTNKNRTSRVSVYLRCQVPTVGLIPAHYASKQLVPLVLSFPLARYCLEGTALHLLTDETWKDTKNRFRAVKIAGKLVVPGILPPRAPELLMLTYPPAHQESDGRRRQAELWMRAERF